MSAMIPPPAARFGQKQAVASLPLTFRLPRLPILLLLALVTVLLARWPVLRGHVARDPEIGAVNAILVGRSWASIEEASIEDEVHNLEGEKHGVGSIGGRDGKEGEPYERIEWARGESRWAEEEGETAQNAEGSDSRGDSREAERVGEISQEGEGEMAESENADVGGTAEGGGEYQGGDAEQGRDEEDDFPGKGGGEVKGQMGGEREKKREGRRRKTTREEGEREATDRQGSAGRSARGDEAADAKLRGKKENILGSSDEKSDAESRESNEANEKAKKRKKRRQRRCRELGVPCSFHLSKKARVKHALETVTVPINGRILSPLDSPEVQKLLRPLGRVLLPGSGHSKWWETRWLPVSRQEFFDPNGRYLFVTGHRDFCAGIRHFHRSLSCRIAEAAVLNRTLVLDMGLCINGLHNEGKFQINPIHVYYDLASLSAVRFTPLQGFLEEAEKWQAGLGRRDGGGDWGEAEGAGGAAEGEAVVRRLAEAGGGGEGGKAEEEGSLRFPVRVVGGHVRTRRLVGDDDTALIVRTVNYGFAACEFNPFHAKPRHELSHFLPAGAVTPVVPLSILHSIAPPSTPLFLLFPSSRRTTPFPATTAPFGIGRSCWRCHFSCPTPSAFTPFFRSSPPFFQPLFPFRPTEGLPHCQQPQLHPASAGAAGTPIPTRSSFVPPFSSSLLQKDYPIASNHSAIQHRPELLALAAEMGRAMGGGDYDAVHVRRGDKLKPDRWPHLDRDTRPPA
ncbi:unnamed protein product [Closterium sp. Naga37s-1]|nr:unnamed protein product [Closterium sp. Naga37s-1]